MSHQRCAGWLGGKLSFLWSEGEDEPSSLRWMAGRKAEFLVEAIVAVLDG